MTLDHLLLALLGTIICAAGLLRPPRSGFDLIRPRFVVPAMIWMATFAQVFLYWVVEQPWDLYATSRVAAGTASLQYLCLSMLAFWVGYALPLGRVVGAPFLGLSIEIGANAQRWRPLGLLLAVAVFAVLLLVGGLQTLGLGGGAGLFGGVVVLSTYIGPLIHIMMAVGAAIIGVSWPERDRRTIFNTLSGLLALLLLSTPYMANFSRGSGLPVLIAVGAAIVRFHRVSWLPTIAAIAWVAVCGHAGLHGRGAHGHYAGVLPFLGFLFTNSIWHWGEVLLVWFGASDGFTPLCVTIAAVDVTGLGQLAPLDWFIFQIPVPRIFGFHPEFTFTLTYYVGGRGSWNYTSGIFGDTYAHFRDWGALLFVIVGCAYRFVDHVAIRPRTPLTLGLNAYLILLVSSYMSMAQGLFNSFRAWVVAFTYPLYLLVALALLLRLIRTEAPPPLSEQWEIEGEP